MRFHSSAATSRQGPSRPAPPTIGLRALTRRFGPGALALDGLDLDVHAGERLVVLGPSGSGKSTLLRLIAGLDSPDSGEVRIAGRDMKGVPPHDRNVALVFQNPALYPHLSVHQNLEFGLRARGMRRPERHQRVHEVAGLLGLVPLLDRRPWALSGGERQRVALGRALARRPSVLLLDEPFSGLDGPLRTSLRGELIDLHEQFGPTLVHVTHDQSEALALGHRLALLDRGRLIQLGTPGEVYDRPAHRFVASFLGSPGMNLVPTSLDRLEDGGSLCLSSQGECPGPFELGIRPEFVRVGSGAAPAQDAETIVASGFVHRVENQGQSSLVVLDIAGTRLAARAPASEAARTVPGNFVWVELPLRHACWFDRASGKRMDARPMLDDCRRGQEPIA